jgi:hypothetical protein
MFGRSKRSERRPAPSPDLLRSVATLVRLHGLRQVVDALEVLVAQRERSRR